jgi:hypothetical protein
MANSTNDISQLIVRQLGGGEKRLLSLVVAVRKGLSLSHPLRGDLTEIVKSALRKLVASEAVVDDDGTYSLALVK